MRLALSIIDLAQEDRAATFSKIKAAVANARQSLDDSWLGEGVDASDKKTTEGKFAALAKRLDEMASNLSESYTVAVEGARNQDQQRKDTFRGLLQESLVNYAEIILALDETAVAMRDQWHIKPDLDRAIPAFGLANLESGLPGKDSPPKQARNKTGEGDKRTRWINESYQTTVSLTGNKKWADVHDKTGDVWNTYVEKTRTDDYVEVYCAKTKDTIRYFAKKAEFSKDGRTWQWVANGHWDTAAD